MSLKYIRAYNIPRKYLSGVVRQPADWMKPADDRILEVIRDEGNMTPLALSKEGTEPRVRVGRKYAGLRCRELARYGLLEKVDTGLYRLTDEGRAYLEEELDASALDPIDDE